MPCQEQSGIYSMAAECRHWRVPPPYLHIYLFAFLSTNLLCHRFGISLFISTSTDSLSFFSCSTVFPSPRPACSTSAIIPLTLTVLYCCKTPIYLIIFPRLPLCSVLSRSWFPPFLLSPLTWRLSL